jgi:hypothetical protein
MNTLFKSLAALVAAFILATPAFAVEYKTLSDGAKVYDCRPTVNNISYKTEVLKEYSDQALRGLAAAGLKPTSRKYWTVTTVDKCEDLMVKPAPQKKGVKALPAKPVSYTGLPIGRHLFCVSGATLSVLVLSSTHKETLYDMDKCTVASTSHNQTIAGL